MNNIPNQLSPKNITKTKWAKQFNKEQLYEINLGIKQGLDVSIYADPKYDWQKMEEIRFKLENELKEKQKYELDFLLN